MDDCGAVGMTNIIKFADDTKCWERKKRDRAELHKILDKISKWADQWGMSFNADKCKVMHIGTGNPRFSYYMNRVKLQPAREV